MAEPARPLLTRDTLVRIAREQGRFTLSAAEADALLELASGLQNEADNAAKAVSGNLEPATEYRLELWPDD